MEAGEEEDLAKLTKFVFPQTDFEWLAAPEDLAVLEPIVLGMYVIDKMHGQREGGPMFFEPINYNADQRTYVVAANFAKSAAISYRSYMALWSRNPGLIRYMYLEPCTSPTGSRQRLVLGILSTTSKMLPRAFADYFHHDRTLLTSPLTAPLAPQHAVPLLAQHSEMNDTKRLVVESLQFELRKMMRPSITNPAVTDYDLSNNLVLQGDGDRAAGFNVQWRLPTNSAVNILSAPYLLNKLKGQIDDIFFSLREEPTTQFGGLPSLSMVVSIFFFPLEGPRRVIDTRTFHLTLDINSEEDEQDTWLFEVNGPREHDFDHRAVRLRGSKRSRETSDEEQTIKVAPEGKRARHDPEEAERKMEVVGEPATVPLPLVLVPSKKRRRRGPSVSWSLLGSLANLFSFGSDSPPTWQDEEEEEDDSD